MKFVKITEDLFCDLFLYHVVGSEESAQRIKLELEKKMDAMLRHDYYTKYKTAPDEAAREEARRKYLDGIGVPQDFRW